MRTVDQIAIGAPMDRVFQIASDVERWPEILSHYRWVRFLDRHASGATPPFPRCHRSSSVGPKSCLTIGGSGFWTATRAVAPWKWRRGGRSARSVILYGGCRR